MKFLIALVLMVAPAFADSAAVLNTRLWPGYDRFAQTTRELSQAAMRTCAPDTLHAPFNSAFDAWMAVAHFRIGPVETDGRGLAIAFWPDTRGTTARGLAQLIAGDVPENFSAQSVAVRGFFAMERLLYDADLQGPQKCELTRAVALDLARMAAEIRTEWPEFAAQLQTAGASGNTRFLSRAEATQAVFTQIVTGLEFNADTRLGRPMGTFERPRPERAEARLSSRSLRNLRLSLAAIEADIIALKSDIPRTFTAMERVRHMVDRLEDPSFAGAQTPAGRLKLEALQQTIHYARDVVMAEIAPALGISAGFNAADGD